MTAETTQNIDLWEAWIDMQCPGENGIATLYVIGEVLVDNSFIEPRLVKRRKLPAHSRELELELKPDIFCEEGQSIEVLYAEELLHLNRYETILIYANNEVVARLENIDLLY